MPRQHGKSIITVEDDIIIIRAIGAFNSEGMTETIQQLKSVITGFDKKQFKLLFNYLETEGGTPEVFDKINQCNIWLNTQNMTAKALVIDSLTNLAILESRTPARRAQNSKNFSDQVSAINWLKSQQ